MIELQWARVDGDGRWQLRRGAWYRVTILTPAEATLAVNQRRVPVARASLKIVSRPPQSWTVVLRSRRAVGWFVWGDRYAVCPGCRNRAPLRGAPRDLRCARCHQTFRVAWDERFIGSG
jgi:hypothetical protein